MSRRNGIFRRLRHDESGMSLPEVLISVLINGAALVTISAAIVTFTVVQQSYAFTASNANQTLVTETQWRGDVQSATKISPVDSTSVVISSALPGGACQADTWAGVAVADKTELHFQSATFTTPPAADGSCNGTGTNSSRTVITDAGPNIIFTYTNKVGRGITFSGGTATLDPNAVQPSNVSASDWLDTRINRAVLSATVSATTTSAQPVTISQTAAKLQQPAPTADASTTYVTP